MENFKYARTTYKKPISIYFAVDKTSKDEKIYKKAMK